MALSIARTLGHTVRSSVYINERLRRSAAVVSIASISNIVISILITGVDVKMARLAVAIILLSVIIAGNSLTQCSAIFVRRPHEMTENGVM